MSEGFAAPGAEAPGVLPGGLVLAVLASRPQRAPGGEPGPVVVLVEVETKGLE